LTHEGQHRIPPIYDHVIDGSNLGSASFSQLPLHADRGKGTRDTDGRSQTAMEELASLMLTMDVNGQGEPSFMMTSRDRKSSNIESQNLPVEYSEKGIGTRVESPIHESLILTLQSRQELMYCFMENFNIFHQYLDYKESISVVMADMNSSNPDFIFRNYALYSVAAYFSDTPELHNIGRMCALSAENMVLNCIRKNASDLIVQGLSLLAWRELNFGNDDMAYNYIGNLTLQSYLATPST
jgi:hypothetical protein